MTVLRTAYVEVKPQLDKFGAELKAKLAKINVGPEGKKVSDTFTKGWGKDFTNKGNEFVKSIAGMSAKIGVLASAAAAATPGLVKMVQAIAPAAGVLTVLPAALVAGGAALATFKLATDGVSKAISAGLTGSAKQAAKALEGMPPAAQKFAKSIIDLKPQIESLRASVTQRFFLPLQNDVGTTAKVYFPLLKKSMADLAGPLGGLGEQLLQTARKGDVVKSVADVFLATKLSVINLRGAVDPLITAFSVLLQSTVPELPALAGGLTKAAKAVSQFVINAVDAGKVNAIFDAGVTTIKQLGSILANVGSILTTVFKAANTSGIGFLANIQALTGQVAAFLKTAQGSAAIQGVFSALAALGQAMRTSLAAVLPQVAKSIGILLPAVRNLAPALASVVVALAPVLPQLVQIVAAIINSLVPAIRVLATWITNNQTTVRNLVVALGLLYVALQIAGLFQKLKTANEDYAIATKISAAATKIWTGIQAAFNFVMDANPITLVVIAIGALVAAIIIAYKNSATFRAIVQGAWNGIKVAVQAVVTWFTNNVLPILKAVYNALATAALWLWHNVIEPAWHGIQAVVSVVVAGVKVYLAALRAEFNIVATVVKWLYNNIFSPLFTAIGYVVKVAWVIIEIALAAMKLYFQNVIAPVVKWLYQNVFLPVWHAIQAVVSAVVTAVKAVLSALKAFFENVLAPAVRAIYNNVIKPTFSAIGSFITAIVNNVLKPIFSGLKAAFSAVGSALKAVWDNVVKPMFSAFGNFLKNTVAPAFSRGVDAIRAAWDKVKAAAQVPVKFVVDHVINPLVGGINSAAKFVGVKDQIPKIKLASGGQIPGSPSAQDNMLAAGPGGPIAVASGEFITNTKSTLANLGLVSAINSKRGRVGLGDVLPYLQGFDNGGVVGAIGGFFKKVINGAKGIGSFVTNPGAALTKVASAGLRQIPAAGHLTDFIKGAGTRLITAVGNWLKSKVSPVVNTITGAAFGGKAPKGALAQWIAQAEALTGVPGSWTGPLNTLIQRESGGNPRSINLWDSNAKNGDPSRGLMQTIGSTFAAYRLKSLPNDIYNPVANIVAGIRYILSRYGSIFNVQQANASLPPKGYSRGGQLLSLGLPVGSYDAGGFLPRGLSIAHNGTGRPEPVGHGLAGNSYTISVTVAPGAHPAETGRQIVTAIQAFERSNGTRWRV